ncbi:hypothetical protein ACFW1A_14735 [Kitasatospora sp. NPDC058965]|uniref:hypothetical protein n=1 Tax=Kitasatospora sp. NPDC058965 TaxID=3346682 RepID=UPI003691BC8B
MHQPHQPAPPVIGYTADGQPFYLTQPTTYTAPLVSYQPAPHPVLVQPGPPYLPSQPLNMPPARDPWPARLAAGGVGIGAAGVGLGFLLQTLAAATTGLGLLAAVLALAWLLKSNHSGGGRGAVNVSVNVSNRNR